MIHCIFNLHLICITKTCGWVTCFGRASFHPGDPSNATRSCFQPMPRNAMVQCFCFDLYGKQMEFGCKWYQAWMENTFRAKRTGKELIVVTKADGTLGNSQKGEVRFLEKRGFKFTFRNISDFAKSHSYLSENAKSLLREIAGS